MQTLKSLPFYAPVRKSIPLTILLSGLVAVSVLPDRAVEVEQPQTQPEFVYTTPTGFLQSVPLVDESAKRKLSDIDPRLARAATIAQERANAHSKSLCWRYVKDALVASGAVESRPETEFAKEAGDELVKKFGFKKLDITDPYAAPIGAVLVYNAKGAPGHVEIRTADGFVSDFRAKTPSRRPLLGVYTKA